MRQANLERNLHEAAFCYIVLKTARQAASQDWIDIIHLALGVVDFEQWPLAVEQEVMQPKKKSRRAIEFLERNQYSYSCSDMSHLENYIYHMYHM